MLVDELFKEKRPTPIEVNFDINDKAGKEEGEALKDIFESHKKGLLLRWHYCLGHMPFKILRNLAKQDRIPRILASVEPLVCAGCQFGKQPGDDGARQRKERRSFGRQSTPEKSFQSTLFYHTPMERKGNKTSVSLRHGVCGSL